MSIYEKLSSIQKELIAPKGQYNDFGKYPYRSCEDIVKALKPLCDKNSCVLYMTNELQDIGGRNYVKATVKLIDLESGEFIESSAHAREEETKKGMDGSQITGASSSYARKYALSGLFCIDNEKDSDATNETPKESKDTTSRSDLVYVDKAHISTLRSEMARTGVSEEYILNFYKVTKLENMTMHQFTSAMSKFKATEDVK